MKRLIFAFVATCGLAAVAVWQVRSAIRQSLRNRAIYHDLVG